MTPPPNRPLVDLVIHNVGTLVTPARVEPPVRGADLAKVVEVTGAAIACKDGRIVLVGLEADVRAATASDVDTVFHDARGALATPGLVDCHAHLAFGGDRADEFDLRNTGAGYEAIHAIGGGIRSSVARTRDAIDRGTLTAQVTKHLDWQLASGTTTTEAKSGYGLTLDAELASLHAIAEAAAAHALDVHPTCLAAHTVPPEYDGDAARYVTDVAMPAVRAAADAELALAADVFLERGSFLPGDTRRYLEAARDAGLTLRLHGDQFSELGGIALAADLGARSIDHLEATGPDGVRDLARSNVAGVLLPLSSLFLQRPYAPGRALVDAGAVVALASDFNPGSSYGESLTLAMSLACVGNGLRAAEAFTAATLNAAWVLGAERQVGRLAVGYRADVCLWQQPDLTSLAYHVGSPALQAVFVAGELAHTG